MNWLTLILSIIPIQDDVPPGRIVAIIIPQPIAQDEPVELFTGPITDAIVRRLDAMQKAWADRETVLSALVQEIEARQEKRDKERFEFLKEWIESLRPGPNGPVDVGPIREFFQEWKAERDHAKTERSEAAAERRSWAEEREQARADRVTAATERRTLLERMTETRTALMEARTAAIEARAAAAAAEAQAKASLQSTGPIREALRLIIWLVVALTVLVIVLAAVYLFVLRK
jgi:cobalamin biosynthesis Mg chelatase CobN